MRVLALDTTTRAGSTALVDDVRVIAERRGDPTRTHAERLPDEIMTLLAACGMPMADVDLFAVACGPGSFTGLRIGIATIQGLAFVNGRRIVGVSALDALAHVASLGAETGTMVGAWMDAHRREVFSGLYRVKAAEPFALDRVAEIEAAAVGDPAGTLARWRRVVNGGAWMFTGDGAVLYADVIRRAAPQEATIFEPPPLAGAIGRIAIARARRGETVAPSGIRPLYVRRPDAEIAREKKDVSHQGH